MKEVWLKKTIWRRYLIEDENEYLINDLLKADPNRGEKILSDVYDNNKNIEYDDEKIFIPAEFEIKKI